MARCAVPALRAVLALLTFAVALLVIACAAVATLADFAEGTHVTS